MSTRPNEHDLDEEIQGHLAISIQQKIDRGMSPEAARLAALREFGYIPKMRDEMHQVWYGRVYDAVEALVADLRVAGRSLWRAKGLAVTVVITLALGIGANAAIFSVVRGVLMRPLVNRGEDRLVYIRQSATGMGGGNAKFSVPEIQDLRARVKAISAYGEFSTVDFTMVGFGEPRVVHAGVVNGAYFDVMGLRPILGRLIAPSDDGLKAAGVVVLTHRFWTMSLNSDPGVVGKSVQLGPRTATVIGVLEPSLPYPEETELIANMITSPHHMGAMMITLRTHRMTDLFGRLAPDASVESARAELTAVHGAIVGEHPESYSKNARMQAFVTPLRDQLTSPARTILLVLLGAAALVFVIACSNVANLILARSVRREGELAVRAALGAGPFALRRTLLAESLVLCGAGAVLGVVLARPFMSVVASFAARFSVRALEVTVDPSILWVGAGLAMAAAVLLAFVPRLPSATAPAGFGVANGSLRMTPATSRRLRLFATTQIAFSFVLLAGASTLVASLLALRGAETGYDMKQVLAMDLPMKTLGFGSPQESTLYQEITRRVGELPGVEGVSLGNMTPWRDLGGGFGGTVQFSAEGFTTANGEENPRGRFRIVQPGFFRTMGIPVVAGRDFTPEDRAGAEAVVVVSQSLAQRIFPNGDALNRKFWWTDPFFGPKPFPRRIVGIAADVDDLYLEASGSALTVYHPFLQMPVAGRMFVRAGGDPYALVRPITKIVRDLDPTQPVERPATLEDIRAEVLMPERINAFVFSGFAGVALLIAVVGVSGVLAFGVSARTREFGVRLAIGSSPYKLLLNVLSEGALIVAIGLVAGAIGGYAFAGIASGYFDNLELPGAVTIIAATGVMVLAALIASLMPAARASRVDVLQALRAE